MTRGILAVAKLRPMIGVIQIDENINGVEQHDEMLRKVGQRVCDRSAYAGGCQ